MINRALSIGLGLGLLAGCGGESRQRGDVFGGPSSVITLDAAADGGQSALDGGARDSADGAAESDGGCARPGVGAACAACEAEMCTTPDFVSGVGQDIDWYAACYSTSDVATDGPAKGVSKATLCKGVVDCVHRTGCDVADDNTPCFCGAGVSGTDCVKPGGASGPCKQEIEWASETTEPLKIGARRFDSSYASGAALGLVLLCDYPPSNPLYPAHPCTSACLGSADGGTACTPAGGGAGGGGGGGGSAGGGGGGSAGSEAGAGGTGGGCQVAYALDPGCASCELGSAAAFCDPTSLSARLKLDEDGNAAPDGFGPGTLPTAQQRDAAYALIHRVLALGCYSDANVTYRPENAPACTTLAAHPCVFANLGCLLDLGQPATDIGSGVFTTNPQFSAVAEYRAAAIADATAGPAAPAPIDGSGYAVPGGVSAGVTNAELGAYINSWATTPSSAIGIADNVLRCGLDAGCAACLTLVSTTTCPTGAGGSGDGGVGGGAGGASGTGGSGAAGSAGTAGGCPDLDGDGIRDCAETSIENATFDRDTASWTAVAGVIASWASSDGTGDTASGSIAVTNTDTNPDDAAYGWTTTAASQCVPVTAGASYEVAVQTYLDPGPGSGWSGFVLDYFLVAGCAGLPAPRPFLSPQVASAGSWQAVSGTTTQIPVGVTSLAVRLVVEKPVAQPSLRALFDNVLVRAR